LGLDEESKKGVKDILVWTKKEKIFAYMKTKVVLADQYILHLGEAPNACPSVNYSKIYAIYSEDLSRST